VDYLSITLVVSISLAAGFLLGFLVVPRLVRRVRQRKLREVSRKIADLTAHMASEKAELNDLIDLLM